MKLDLENMILYSIGGFLLLLVIVFGIIASGGSELEYVELDRNSDTTSNSETVTCNRYHETVVSTYSQYETFIDECGITITLSFDEEYFLDNVLVIYLYKGEKGQRPKRFNDYPYSQDGKEIIQVKNNNNRQENEEYSYMYLISMSRDEIGSFYVIIG